MTIPSLILRPGQPPEYGSYSVGSFSELPGHEPDGVYTIARTYGGNACIHLDAHLDRLEESARLSGSPFSIDRHNLREGLRALIQSTGYPETRFRITIPFNNLSTVILAAEPLQLVPDELRASGVFVTTCEGARSIPRAKRNDWLQQRQAIRKRLPPDCYEGIIRNKDGLLLEGLSSNFYAIIKGTLYTAEENILHGITRRVVLELADGLLSIQYKPIHQALLPELDEAFLTSSSREVLSIVCIDGKNVSDGKPGPFTRDIANRYHAWVEAHLEQI